jgi:hypothetical protein
MRFDISRECNSFNCSSRYANYKIVEKIPRTNNIDEIKCVKTSKETNILHSNFMLQDDDIKKNRKTSLDFNSQTQWCNFFIFNISTLVKGL